MEDEAGNCVSTLLKKVAYFVVHHPFINAAIVLFVILLMALFALIPALGAKPFPDFSNPTKGFEPRGTTISDRLLTYQNMYNAFFGPSATLLSSQQVAGALQTRSLRSTISSSSGDIQQQNSSSCPLRIGWLVDGMKTVYSTNSGHNLFSARALQDVCKLHYAMAESNGFYAIWNHKANGNPTRGFSLGNYVAEFANRSSCFSIRDEDVVQYQNLLKRCLPWHLNLTLPNCALGNSASCQLLPLQCSKSAVMISITFQYLINKDYNGEESSLSSTMVIDCLDRAWSNEITTTLYKYVYNSWLTKLGKARHGTVHVSAFKFGSLKSHLFDVRLLSEMVLVMIAVVAIGLLVALYTGSVFLGLATVINVVLSLVMAYFLYMVVFRIAFFPFLNLTAAVILVGIAADDAFVFIKIWHDEQRLISSDRGDLSKDEIVFVMAHTIWKASHAMLVTSITTSAAFLAGLSGSVPAVRCFGVFAGTSVLCNYLLMIVFYPCLVIIHQLYLAPFIKRLMLLLWKSCCARSSRSVTLTTEEGQTNNNRLKFTVAVSKMGEMSWKASVKVFHEYIPSAIIKLKFVLIFVLTGLGIGALVVIFVTPKLSLPISSEFQMFSDSNSLEQYALHYRSLFRFENKQSSSAPGMTVEFVIGLPAVDRGNKLNPDDKGSLKLGTSGFNPFSPASQLWLLSFCDDLLRSSFYYSSNLCAQFLEFSRQLQLPCNVSVESPPCCGRNLSLSENDFMQCLSSGIGRPLVSSGFTGILYNQQHKPVVLVIDLITKQQYTVSYQVMNSFYNTLEAWLAKHPVPSSLSTSWWWGWLDFYDLQKQLVKDTGGSVGIALAVSFLVVILSTRNILLALISAATISFIVAVTVAIFVLAGWRLNVLESIIFTIAAGLAVDFALHYAVTYQTLPKRQGNDDEPRDSSATPVHSVLSRIGSAVAMGALTTFIAGLAIVPAQVLAYIRFSHFLMLVMVVSWIYATFLLLPLCCLVKPTTLSCKKISAHNCRNSSIQQAQGTRKVSLLA